MYTILFYFNFFFRFQQKQLTMTELYESMASIEGALIAVLFFIVCFYIWMLLDEIKMQKIDTEYEQEMNNRLLRNISDLHKIIDAKK
jgi:hypothetical protein